MYSKLVRLLVLPFVIFLVSCGDEKREFADYNLIDLTVDTLTDEFYICGTLANNLEDTFAQSFLIMDKWRNGCCDYPDGANYRAHMRQAFKYTKAKVPYLKDSTIIEVATDSLYIVLAVKHGKYFNVGKEYWFKFNRGNKDVIAFFRD